MTFLKGLYILSKSSFCRHSTTQYWKIQWEVSERLSRTFYSALLKVLYWYSHACCRIIWLWILQPSIVFCESTLRVQYNYLQLKNLIINISFSKFRTTSTTTLAMMIYNKTRNLDLIEKLSELGLCLSR